MTFEEACRAVVAAGDDPKQVNQVNYAVGYARAGLRMVLSHEKKVQALYILNNITRWRGDTAKAVRAFLKEYAK